MIKTNYLSHSTTEKYGHIYHIQDGKEKGEEIHGIKKDPGFTPPHGTFATVKWARNLKTGALLARRICVLNDPKNPGYYTDKRQKANYYSAEKCTHILEELKDIPGIVPYHGYDYYLNKHNKYKVVFFFDKANGDLYSLLKKAKKTPLDTKTQLSFAKQLLEVLHKVKGAHGDFKPANILEKDGQLWLSDFDHYQTTTGDCGCGTLDYAAPEVLKTHECQDLRKHDVWGVGITLFFIFTNTLDDFKTPKSKCTFPWLVEENKKRAQEMIFKFDPIKFSKVLEAKIANPQVRHLLSMMLQPDPANRCTIDEAYAYFMTHIQPPLDQPKALAPDVKRSKVSRVLSLMHAKTLL